MRYSILCLALVLTGVGCAERAREADPVPGSAAQWRLVYQHDENGEPIEGRVGDLIAAMMSTNGNYHQFHYDLRTGEVTRIMRARTQVAWFGLVPPEDDRPIHDLTPRGAFHLESVSTP